MSNCRQRRELIRETLAQLTSISTVPSAPSTFRVPHHKTSLQDDDYFVVRLRTTPQIRRMLPTQCQLQRSVLRASPLRTRSSLAVATPPLCSQLSGCNGGNDPPLPQLTTPDASTAQHETSSIDAFTSEATSGPNLAAAQYIDASSAGLVGDGKTHNTAVLQGLLGSGNRTIHIPAGDYVTGKLEIPPNTALLLDSGVILQDSGQLGPVERPINIESTNIYISGSGTEVLGDRNAYPPGEQRHGVFINGANNFVIDGLQSSNNAGDGFYIGSDPGQPSQNIVLNGCLASNNRGQGLSIVSARNVYVVNCEFEHTQGTAPQRGISSRITRLRLSSSTTLRSSSR